MIESDVDCVSLDRLSENEERTKFAMDLSKNIITSTVEGVTNATEEAKASGSASKNTKKNKQGAG